MDQSYDFKNVKRDLSDVISVVVAQEPSILSVVQMGGGTATQRKHEWLEDQYSAELVEVTAEVAVDGETLPVSDAAMVQPGMVLSNEGDEAMRIIAVDAEARTCQVARSYGGTTPRLIPAGRRLRVVSRPRPEGTPPGDDPAGQPDTQWNQVEIFDTTAVVSGTAQAVEQYGITSAIDDKVQRHMKILSRRMNNALIYGPRVERSKTSNGSMGGLLYYLSQPGALRVPAAGQELSLGAINDVTEQIVLRGGKPGVLICNTNQARRISAQNRDKVVVEREDKARGSAVYQIVGDLPLGHVTRIVVEPNFPRSKVLLLQPDTVSMIPLKGRSLWDEDATPPGADFVARRVMGEYTMEWRNALETAAVIEELSE